MNILLINTNPVVSRLLVLCTRDDAVILNEVSTVDEIEENTYDIVLVDEASYGQNVTDFLVKLGTAKKVFISYQDDEIPGFDMTIKKPFLPSQILEVIQSVELPLETKEITEEPLSIDTLEEEKKVHSIFPLASEEGENTEISEDSEVEEEPLIFDSTTVASKDEDEVPVVLDGDEIEKIKALLDMDEQIDVVDEILSGEALEVRKIEVIKEQLISDGIEIIAEDEIVGELSIDLDGTLHKSENLKKKKSKSKKSKLTEKNMKYIEDAVKSTMSKMTKKQMKKLLKGKEIEISVKLEDND